MRKRYLLYFLLLLSVTMHAQNWNLSNSGIPDKFNTFSFFVASSTEVYAVGTYYTGTVSEARMYKTTDGGSSWVEHTTTGLSTYNYIYTSACMAGSKMFINAMSSSSTHAIFSSVDGNTWTLSNSGIPDKFNTYDFIVVSSSEIYAVGAYFDGTNTTPRIYKTSNSGASWSEVSHSGMSAHQYIYTASCYVGSKMFVHAVSSSGIYAIYSSTDGLSWTLSNSGVPADFSVYEFVSSHPSEVYAVGAVFNGTNVTPKIYKSTNGGTSWADAGSTGITTHDYIYNTACVAGNKMFINAMSNSSTFAIYSSSLPVSIASTSFVSKPFKVYPVPASDNLFVDSEPEFDEIRVMDLTGKLVARSTDAKLDVSSLPPSIYIMEVSKSGKSLYRSKIQIQ